nr:carbonyl reductase [NADPH] 1-like [Loxodonta africana]
MIPGKRGWHGAVVAGLAVLEYSYLSLGVGSDAFHTGRVASVVDVAESLYDFTTLPQFHSVLFSPKDADPTPFHIQAEVTLKTNFFGTRDVCTELLPLIKPQGRVVNVSSMVSLGALRSCSPELQQKFRSETITEEELVALMNKFVEDTKNGVHQKEGWPNTAYGVSKIGVTVLSRIYARNLSAQRGGDKILLNACCPGWVRTDMAGPRATKSPEEGAETPVYLALLPSDADGPHGQFVMEKRVERW